MIKSIYYKTQKPFHPYLQNYLIVRPGGYEYSLSKSALLAIYVVITLSCEGCVFGCYYFLGLCKQPMNPGIITSLFTCSLIFTSALFYCFYGQKIGLISLIGMVIIVAGVLVLAFSSSSGSFDILPEDAFNTQMSILFALIASISFSMASLFFKWAMSSFGMPPGFDLNELMYDANLFYGLTLMTIMFAA